MISFFISVLAAFFFALVYERTEQVAMKIALFASTRLPAPIREDRAEEWVAEIEDVDGKLWKLLTSVGYLWHCRLEILSQIPGVKIKPKFLVQDLWGGDFCHRTVMPIAVAVAALKTMESAYQDFLDDTTKSISPLSENPPENTTNMVTGTRVFLAHSLPPDLIDAPSDQENQ